MIRIAPLHSHRQILLRSLILTDSEVDLVLLLCSPLTSKPSSRKAAQSTLQLRRSPPSSVPRHYHLVPGTGLHDFTDHGVMFVALASRSTLVRYALVLSRVEIYLPLNSPQRPQSTVRCRHILAFTTRGVRGFRQHSAVDEMLLRSRCTGTPRYPFVCTTNTRVHRPSSSCCLCRLGDRYQRLYPIGTPHTAGS